MSFLKTKNKENAQLYNESEGVCVRNSAVDTKEVPASFTKGFTSLQGRSPTSMEPRELEWSDDGLGSPKRSYKRKLLQSPLQRFSEALGNKNKKRKRPREKNPINDASKNGNRLHKNKTTSLL